MWYGKLNVQAANDLWQLYSPTSGSADVCTGPSRSSQRPSEDHQQGKQSTGITGITPPCIGTTANKNLPRDIEWSSLALLTQLEEKKEKKKEWWGVEGKYLLPCFIFDCWSSTWINSHEQESQVHMWEMSGSVWICISRLSSVDFLMSKSCSLSLSWMLSWVSVPSCELLSQDFWGTVTQMVIPDQWG